MASADLTYLKEFCRGDRNRMAKYIKTFLETVPEALAEIDRSLKDSNQEALKKAVHSIKPQVTFLGLNGLKENADRIEEILSSPSNRELSIPMIVELKIGLEKALEELIESLLSLS